MTLADEMIIEKRIEHDLGKQEGIALGKLEAAKGMKAKKIPLEDIAEITGISREEIEKL